ncbi:MAG: hypothetical protein GY822_14190 [Deltaproteobacteria bacterium]|nr:hypothetical protein [Deltaproteobacteria bacterium]
MLRFVHIQRYSRGLMQSRRPGTRPASHRRSLHYTCINQDLDSLLGALLNTAPEHRAYQTQVINPHEHRCMKDEVLAVRKMRGCEKYALYKNTKEDQYLLYEEWSSTEDFAAFQKSDRLKNSVAALGATMAGAPDSAYFNATKVP